MKLILCVLAILMVLLFVASLIGADYMVKYSLSPRENRNDFNSILSYFNEKHPELTDWVDGMVTDGKLTDTFVTMPSGERHHGYILKRDDADGRTVIAIHGYKSCAYHMLDFARMFYDNFHCNVVLPDLHAHYQSDGEMIQMGWKDADDIIYWSEIAQKEFAVDGKMGEIVIFGVSMGAATTMNISGKENLPPFIKGFIADCGYTSVWDEFAYVGKRDFHLPKFPLLHIANKMCKNRYGWDFKEASPLESVKRCTLPMLFIHGECDDFVPTEMVYPLYEAKQGEKYIWIAPGSGHAKAFGDHPQEYLLQVTEFMNRLDF